MIAAKKPRASDVARWVADLARVAPSSTMVEDSKLDRREKDRARASLRSWDLDTDGQPVKAVAS